MPIAEFDDVSLLYELSGPATGPVIAFANSLGSDLHMWDKVLPYFESDFRVLRFDTRGHGLSSVPVLPYSIELLGTDVLRLLDRLSIESVALCGLSLGGLVGIWLAIHAPKRVTELILANSAARFLSREAWEARIAFVESQGMASLAAATLSRWFTPEYVLQHPEEMKVAAAMIERTPQQGYIGCCEILRDADLRGSLSKIDTSCLVIAGTRDPATPLSDARVLQAGIPESKFVELDASHLSVWEKPAGFASAMLEFLSRKDLYNGRS